MLRFLQPIQACDRTRSRRVPLTIRVFSVLALAARFVSIGVAETETIEVLPELIFGIDELLITESENELLLTSTRVEFPVLAYMSTSHPDGTGATLRPSVKQVRMNAESLTKEVKAIVGSIKSKTLILSDLQAKASSENGSITLIPSSSALVRRFDHTAGVGFSTAYTNLEIARGLHDEEKLAIASKHVEQEGNALGERLGELAMTVLQQGGAIDPLVDAYIAVKSDFRELHSSGDLQPLGDFGATDVYPISSYRQMLRNSGRATAFFKSESSSATYFGSGVFVGPNLILTADHVAASILPKSTVARRFPSVLDPPGESPAPDSALYIVVDVLLRGTTLPYTDDGPYADLALVEVRLASGGQDTKLEPLYLGRPASSDALERAVYVLAFHKAHQQIAASYDNGYILFPSRASASELGQIALNAVGLHHQRRPLRDALDYIRTSFGPRSAETSSEAIRVLSLYGVEDPFQTTPGVSYRLRASTKSANRHPRLGFDLDVAGGNSGAAVFDKEEGRLVGIVTDGLTDPHRKDAATWRYHGQGVALEAVVKFLAHYLSNRTNETPDLDVEHLP